ncbi:uncharacterized protein SEPMUDRAFT_141785 [Sphaerulina musiva SO2202]|uniref:Uncharacterized protein n=1 Tax=Sphaerulina musiva (strain SO2202) TaxID=692275 RepID=M3D500_SPHMS|nr:uncharacterized protein SEPMUDRAFT_141785 [Sphaerulina musiva SO2202]EMF12949.1 hypothetical protein SEPMUDRAFT_141785 [Sphaerulina musiva SO2202]
MMQSTFFFFFFFLLWSLTTSAQFNNPPGVDIWCGKAYRVGNSSFNPGGQFLEPEISETPLLNLKIAPRYSIYLEDERSGGVIINASISYLVGVAFVPDGDFITLGKPAEFDLDLSGIPAQLQPYNLTIVATHHLHPEQSYTASTEFFKLPTPSGEGSAARIDNLLGGLSARRAHSTDWIPIFPYTYYVQWTLYWHSNLSTLEEFSQMGYNLIHIVPTGDLGNETFPWDLFQPYLDKAAELGLWLQYDVLFQPDNFTNMLEQISRLKSHPSILTWYIADEPDGKSNPLNATRMGYEQIRSLDKYHPISEALNCKEFYYEFYADGADIIMSDVYPVSTNTSFSTVYFTECNQTYGCCGCDDCEGSLRDVSERLDWFKHMDDIVGWEKTHWGVPQAFGNETFWTRYPTPAEEVVMTMLSINHGAHGIVMWDFPTTPEILQITTRLAPILTNSTISNFFLTKPRIALSSPSSSSSSSSSQAQKTDIDATIWIDDEIILVSIVNLGLQNLGGEILIDLPDGIKVDEKTRSDYRNEK